MKVLCPVCGELAEAKEVRPGPDGLSWRCGACGQQVSESTRELQSRHEIEDEGPGGTDRCPKCGAPRTERPDCPRCGLVFERWDPSSGLELVPVLEAAWEELLDSYGEQAAHDRFVAKARELGRLDLAAAYYRARAAEHRGDELAPKQLERIAAMVQFEALVPRQRHRIVSPSFVWAMRILLGLAVLAGLYYVFTFSVPPPVPVQGAGPSMAAPGGTGMGGASLVPGAARSKARARSRGEARSKAPALSRPRDSRP